MPATSRNRSGVAADHAGGEVLLDAIGRSWGRGAQEPRFELLAVGAVVDPFTGRRDPLAGGNGRRMPDDSHDVTVPTRLSAQNAEAIIDIVVSDALDEAGEDFRV